MKRIIVSVTNDLVTDQRVFKICKTLEALNFDILLIGRKLKKSPSINRNYKTYRMRLLFNKGFLFYAEYNLRLFLKLLFSKKSVLLANDLDTLLPNYLVSVLQKKKLVYDSHELFTEVPELISRPKTQKIWLKIEEWILPKLKHCYTVSHPIANYYNKNYNLNFRVIRNLPENLEINESIVPWKNKDNKKIIIYQGAVNVGRGLELMIETMKFLDNHIFIIIGAGDIIEDLKRLVTGEGLEEKVQFFGRINSEKLKYITPNADIGISLEEDLGLSYRYALPNKIFDYIHAGIPILVSNLPEMKKIVEVHKVGKVITSRNPRALAIEISDSLIYNHELFEENSRIARSVLNWEIESKVLNEIFKSIE